MTRRSISWSRPLWSAAGLLLAYYAFPVRLDARWPVLIGSLALTAVGLALLAWTMVKELDRIRHGEQGFGAQMLGMLLVLLVVAFSLTFYLLNLVNPDQVAGLSTRTDALYFTVSTMSTVGYGDVHAEGQVARALVCCLIAFNVVVVAALLRVQTSRRAGQL